ncbi:MAG: hypothetical protein EZS28_020880 [Streblomastix strix]|uniref:Uncharacterized protein n=1 Tax=Streblomastix strix TaxID=222440 RepID=A0A5J4VMC0_9EUKA|nr:MAG: hypothetical protein EZS28_020880 [Streblomastix strix]
MKYILIVQLKDHPRKDDTIVQIAFRSFVILVDSVSVEASVVIVMDFTIHLVGVFMDIQPNETQHAYADCSRAVALQESALIAEIQYIIPDQPSSRYLIDAYFMCLTAGVRQKSIRSAHSSQGQSRNQASSNYRSALAQFPPAHDIGQYYGRRDNYRERTQAAE